MRTVHVPGPVEDFANCRSQESTPSRDDLASRWLSTIWPAVAAF
jgi:hypothetical protein